MPSRTVWSPPLPEKPERARRPSRAPRTTSPWATPTTSSPDLAHRRSLRALATLLAAGAALLLSPVPGLAQTTDQELKDLIPDAAVANPESWANSAPAAAPATSPIAGEPAAPDPAAPMAELPGLTVPWPDSLPQPPALASLPAEPDVAQALAQEQQLPKPDAALAGEEIKVGNHLTLVFPQTFKTFPEQGAFVDRFRALSALRKYDTDKDSIAQVAARARADKDLLERLLRIYGYYDALVTQTVGNPRVAGAAAGETSADAAVRFYIAPGERYRFGAIDLGHLSLTGPDYPRLRGAFPILTGDPIDNDRIVSARNKLDTDLGESGYAFAKVGDPDLLVDHKRAEGDLTIPTEPGGKYRFGQVISRNPRFLSSHHLADIARFERGDLYKRSDQDDLKRAILATGLVSSVTVTPREVAPPPATGQNGQAPTGEVALDVSMVPGPLRTIAGLAGYDTGDGVRLEASWEHRNFFPPEGMLRVRGIAGTKEQLVGTTVRWNNFHGRDQVLTLDLYGNTVKREAYTARTVAFAATFEKLTTLLFQKPWTWSVGLETLATQERESAVTGQSVPRNTYFVAALPLRGAIDRSDNLLDPTTGWRASLRISPEISKQKGGPQVTYARIQADASAYYPVNDRLVIAGRTRVGSIPGTALENIAPSRRFYAGGGGSVRGYGYQQIGPRDTANAPSGGRSLVELSLEARIGTGLMGGALQLVPFIDAGSVSASITPTFRDMRYGAGLGLRYKTGFGPVRIDLGTPLNPRPGDSRISVSVALGQSF
ncbi:MAG TPA: BamA/TamA family outer membrane protein [Novosphingobium sp.]|nr:BamA/TamA family outer membrane protein [Novosphingobium sp.]